MKATNEAVERNRRETIRNRRWKHFWFFLVVGVQVYTLIALSDAVSENKRISTINYQLNLMMYEDKPCSQDS